MKYGVGENVLAYFFNLEGAISISHLPNRETKHFRPIDNKILVS